MVGAAHHSRALGRRIFPLGIVMISACSSGQDSVPDCLGRAFPAADLDGTARLTWTPPSTRSDGSPFDDLSGYRIYYGIEPEKLSCRIEISDAKAVEWKVTDLSPGTWHFAVASVDSANVESKLSGVVSKQID